MSQKRFLHSPLTFLVLLGGVSMSFMLPLDAWPTFFKSKTKTNAKPELSFEEALLQFQAKEAVIAAAARQKALADGTPIPMAYATDDELLAMTPEQVAALDALDQETRFVRLARSRSAQLTEIARQKEALIQSAPADAESSSAQNLAVTELDKRFAVLREQGNRLEAEREVQEIARETQAIAAAEVIIKQQEKALSAPPSTPANSVPTPSGTPPNLPPQEGVERLAEEIAQRKESLARKVEKAERAVAAEKMVQAITEEGKPNTALAVDDFGPNPGIGSRLKHLRHLSPRAKKVLLGSAAAAGLLGAAGFADHAFNKGRIRQFLVNKLAQARRALKA